MSRLPAISLVLPVWNAAATPASAVESVELQSERDWKPAAVDDGSTDDSREIPRSIAARTTRALVGQRRRSDETGVARKLQVATLVTVSGKTCRGRVAGARAS